MIASGALGNPHIFLQANRMLDGKRCMPISWGEKRASFLEYAALAGKYGVATPKRLRAQAIEWVTGFNGVKGARKMLNAAKTGEGIVGVMGWFEPQASL
jgi:tRNA-dihydrouridine synthase